MEGRKSLDTRKLVLLALFTAIVFVLQFLGAIIKLGPFSISLVLLPIVVGAALIGTMSGAWLGFAFGVVVLISGDAAAFLAVSPLATVAVVLIKGALAGLAAGALYAVIAKKNKTAAVVVAAAACPIVNTGVFIIGSYMFFLPTITAWAADAGAADATTFIFFGMVGFNFLLELGINLVLSPVIVRLIHYGQDRRNVK